MKYFTSEWWAKASYSEEFGKYEESLAPVRERVPADVHWVLGSCALHDGRYLSLEFDNFRSMKLSMQIDHGDICGRVTVVYASPSSVTWSSDRPIADVNMEPPVMLGYHEFSLDDEGRIQHNMLFDPRCELVVTCASIGVEYEPIPREKLRSTGQ